MDKFKKDFRYLLIIGISGLSGIGVIFFLKSMLSVVDFANYVEASIYFNLLLILIELGGYTRLQFHISNLDIIAGKQFGFSVVVYQNILYISLLFYVYLFKSELLVYSFLNVILYTNYIWLFTALKKEAEYYNYLIIQKIFGFIFVFFINWNYLLFITSTFHFLVILLLFRGTPLNFLVFFNNLKKLFSFSWVFSTTSLVNQMTLRLIDFRILNSDNFQALANYGYVKSFYDRIGSLISQHIVNRSFVLSSSINLPDIIKIFGKGMLIAIGVFLVLLMDIKNLLMLGFQDKVILLVMFTLMILNSILVRVLLKMNFDKFLLGINIIIFFMFKYMFLDFVGLELVVLNLIIILAFLIIGLVFRIKLKNL